MTPSCACGHSFFDHTLVGGPRCVQCYLAPGQASCPHYRPREQLHEDEMCADDHPVYRVIKANLR